MDGFVTYKVPTTGVCVAYSKAKDNAVHLLFTLAHVVYADDLALLTIVSSQALIDGLADFCSSPGLGLGSVRPNHSKVTQQCFPTPYLLLRACRPFHSI